MPMGVWQTVLPYCIAPTYIWRTVLYCHMAVGGWVCSADADGLAEEDGQAVEDADVCIEDDCGPGDQASESDSDEELFGELVESNGGDEAEAAPAAAQHETLVRYPASKLFSRELKDVVGRLSFYWEGKHTIWHDGGRVLGSAYTFPSGDIKLQCAGHGPDKSVKCEHVVHARGRWDRIDATLRVFVAAGSAYRGHDYEAERRHHSAVAADCKRFLKDDNPW